MVSEAAFTRTVLEAARVFGWRSFHPRPARTLKGWRTPVQGDGTGWPDLVLIRGSRLIVAELKMPGRKTTAEQDAWLAAFAAVPGVQVYTWTPDDWDAIEDVLRNG